MRNSFALRLAFAFAAVGMAAAAITALLVNVAFGNRFDDYLAQQRRGTQTELIMALQDSYERKGGWDLSDLKELSALALVDGGELRLADNDGNVVWEPTATSAGAAMVEAHRQMAGSGPLGPEQQVSVVVAGEQVGTVLVRVPVPGLDPEDVSFRSAVNRLLFLGGLVAGLLALGLGVLLARRTVAPARELTAAAGALAAGDRAQRVRVRTSDEWGAMGNAFNTMAETIEEEDRLRRLFATDVAHELRTPLTILRSQVEALQDGVAEPTPEVLDSLREETLRLTRLVEDLEALSSAEAARFSLKPEEVELDVLIGSVAGEFADPFDEKGVSLDTTLTPCRAKVDPTRIGQIVTNLLSNALKFTPEGGMVELTLTADVDRAVLRVSDSGEGIPDPELPFVFDRFYRGSGARARGSGIGLTVVRELAEAHGGSAEASNKPGAGASLAVSLPLS